MKDSILRDKSYAFAIRIIKLYKYVSSEYKEYVLSKQILRSGTAVGALIREAQFGQTRPDFITKMSIALKEANETEYWLSLLKDTDFINSKMYESLEKDIKDIIFILI